jgi:hypothetical protein
MLLVDTTSSPLPGTKQRIPGPKIPSTGRSTRTKRLVLRWKIYRSPEEVTAAAVSPSADIAVALKNSAPSRLMLRLAPTVFPLIEELKFHKRPPTSVGDRVKYMEDDIMYKTENFERQLEKG